MATVIGRASAAAKCFRGGICFALAALFSIGSGVMAQAPEATPAAALAPMQLSLKFYNGAMRQSAEPLPLKFGEGLLLVEMKWTPVLTDKDDVQYSAWIQGAGPDWATANTTRDPDAVNQSGFRQHAYLGKVRMGATSGTRIKMQFGYRPAGLTSFPVNGSATALPEAMPLPPGTYAFTACVQRTGPDGVVDQATAPFTVIITGDSSAGAVYGLSDKQVFQRSSKAAGDIPLIWAGSQPNLAWQASVGREGQSIVTTSGTTTGAVTEMRLKSVPVGGPYEISVSVGGAARTFKDVYVGDLWIISGQSNAVGCGNNAALGAKPIPGVHCLEPRYNLQEWTVARDGFFEHTVGSWVTAAQEFYGATAVPVGLMGHAVGSKPMDYFLDPETGDPFILRPLIEQHGVGAAAFFWYQGESDSFQPAQEAAYQQKLTKLAGAIRQLTQNPNLMIGVCQLGRYTWFKDDHFTAVREAQRQFVLQDRRAVLYSTLPYVVNAKDRIHLETEGYIALGKQIGRQMIELERTGKAITPGPTPQEVRFADAERKQIAITLSRGHGLSGNPSPDEWFVTDETRRGFRNGGFVEIESITFQPEEQRVLIQLKQAPSGATEVSYGYRSDVGGSLINSDGFAAPAFVRVPVQP